MNDMEYVSINPPRTQCSGHPTLLPNTSQPAKLKPLAYIQLSWKLVKIKEYDPPVNLDKCKNWFGLQSSSTIFNEYLLDSNVVQSPTIKQPPTPTLCNRAKSVQIIT